MSIVENVNRIKNVFADIKSEIEGRGITVADGVAVTEYPSLISQIPTGAGQSPADIFNHGDVKGLNPYYSCSQKLYQTNSTSWKISDQKIYVATSYNANIIFGAPIYRGNYTKICFDCEVLDGETADNSYAIARFGARLCSEGMPADRSVYPTYEVVGIDYGTQTNYDNTSPWNELKRQVVEFDLSVLPAAPFFLMLQACDCDVNIYSIWLE